MTNTPYSFGEAREAAKRAALLQFQAENTLRDSTKSFAEAERQYRMALARTIVEVHASGAAWTVAQDLARGDKDVAHLRYLRDVAEGVKEASVHAAWRHAADRRDVEELIRWSARRDLAEDPVAA